jgi:cytochrome P450
LFDAVEHVFDFRGGREAFETTPDGAAAQAHMAEYGTALIAAKRAEPTDDMLSIVVHATLDDVDGPLPLPTGEPPAGGAPLRSSVEPPSLTDAELFLFFSLLFSAGSETTRNAIAGGLLALIERPDQLRALRDDPSLLPTATEEMLRWTTPSPSKRRTATRAATLGGHDIAAGDKVLFWEASANRDERVFDGSMTFDIRRDPNPHLSFGHGVHFCLGASLARLELRVVYEELLPRFTTYEVAGPVEWTRSNRHTGIRHLPLVLSRPG